MNVLIDLIRQLNIEEGIQPSLVEHLTTYHVSHPYRLTPQIYEPSIGFVFQGEQTSYIRERQYVVKAGQMLVAYFPTPVESTNIQATENQPFIGLTVTLSRERMSRIFLKMNQTRELVQTNDDYVLESMMTGSIDSWLYDLLERLLKVMANPIETAVLADSIIDELYFRLMMHKQHGLLWRLLNQQGTVYELSKAIHYVHMNIDSRITVEELATVVNLSTSNFHKKFKVLMNMSPIQYVKSIKLDKARDYLRMGKSVGEVCDLVGYNSPPQFSREFKRHFGSTPSAERKKYDVL